MNKAVTSISIGLAFFITVNLHAALEVFHIDFSDSAGGPGGNWNTVGNTFLGETYHNDGSGLVHFITGNAVNGTSVTNNFTTPTTAALTNPPFDDWVDPAGSAGDFFFRTVGDPATVTVNGLTGSSYTVEVVNAIPAGNSPPPIVNVTVGGNPANSDSKDLGADLMNWDYNQAAINGNWLIWDNVMPDEGQITITVNPSGSAVVLANAIRIADVNAVVPEPSTYVMFGTMILGAGIMLWRKRNNREEEATSV